MKRTVLGALSAATVLLSPAAALAETEIQFWHAFTGRLGDLVAAQVEQFNTSQDDYKVVASHKGNYSETLNAGQAVSVLKAGARFFEPAASQGPVRELREPVRHLRRHQVRGG